MAAGLYVVQLCSLLLSLLLTAGIPALQSHVEHLLFQQDEAVETTLIPVLTEWLQHIDVAEAGGAHMQQTITALLQLIAAEQQQPTSQRAHADIGVTI